MRWRRPVAVLAAVALAGSMTLWSEPAKSIQKRTLSAELVQHIKSGPKTMLQFRPGMNTEGKRAALKRLNQELSKARVPNSLRDSVREWQRMPESRQMQLLSESSTAAIGAGAAVGAAAAAFIVAAVVSYYVNSSGDAGEKDFKTRRLTGGELDMLDSLKAGPPGGYGGFDSGAEAVAASALDW